MLKRWLLLFFLFSALLLGEAFLYESMFPVTPGTPEDFWTAATLHDFSKTGSVLITAKADGDYFYYSALGYHGDIHHRVSRINALRDFPRILATLRTLPPPADPSDYGEALQDVSGALREWDLLSPPEQTPERLVDLLVSHRLAAITPLKPAHAHYRNESHASLLDAIARSHRYPLTCLFEILFLSLILLLIAFPLLRSPSATRIMIIWPLATLLFFTPHWLGFASCTRSPWGPSGGILYPHLIWYSGHTELFPLEAAFLDGLPKPLESLSQDNVIPFLTFFTGSIATGPHLAAYYMLGALLAAAGVHKGRLYLAEAKRRHPGFPVLSTSANSD